MELNKAKEKAEDLVVQLRELVAFLRKSISSDEQDAQKEQLKVIGDSVQHLEKMEVPVPEDLIKLKSKLERSILEAEKHQVLIYFLKEQLQQILSDMGGAARKGDQVDSV